MKKQTAVEWLFEQVCSEKLSWNKDNMGKLFIDLKTSDIFQRAKAMEKEQVVEAHDEARIYRLKNVWKHDDGKRYYNETYGGEE